MNKELEALERIKQSYFTAMSFLGVEDKETKQAINIIETALKDYEQLKIDFLKEATENDYLKTALENIKNHIVEIKEGNIIEKPVNNNELIIRFRKFDNTEECDLLKEVLL